MRTNPAKAGSQWCLGSATIAAQSTQVTPRTGVVMEIDRRHFIASLGGTAAVALMSHEARAEALEEYMVEQLITAGPPAQAAKFPSVEQVEANIETRHYRRGAGNLF